MFKKWSKRLTVTAVFAGVALAAGVAFAAWTATGTGGGTAVATSLTFTVDAVTSAPTGDLYPKSTATGTLRVKVHNTSPFAINVTDLSWTDATAADATSGGNPDGGTNACSESSVTLSGTGGALGSPVLVSAGGTANVDYASAVKMATSADTDCQLATFTWTGTEITVTAAQA